MKKIKQRYYIKDDIDGQEAFIGMGTNKITYLIDATEEIQSEIDTAIAEERARKEEVIKQMLMDINFLDGITGKKNREIVYKNHQRMKEFINLITKEQ